MQKIGGDWWCRTNVAEGFPCIKPTFMKLNGTYSRTSPGAQAVTEWAGARVGSEWLSYFSLHVLRHLVRDREG